MPDPVFFSGVLCGSDLSLHRILLLWLRFLLYFDQVIAKLCFYRSYDMSRFCIEGCVFEFFYHLTFSELAQVSALCAGRAGGRFSRCLFKGLFAVYDCFQNNCTFSSESVRMCFALTVAPFTNCALFCSK